MVYPNAPHSVQTATGCCFFGSYIFSFSYKVPPMVRAFRYGKGAKVVSLARIVRCRELENRWKPVMNEMMSHIRRAVAILVLLSGSAFHRGIRRRSEELERNTRDAVERVVESHDTTLLLGGGKLMIKQSAIRSARKLLGEWGREAGLGGAWWDDAPQYRAAKAELLKSADSIIERRYASGVWLKQAWTQYTAKELNGEEADVIATQFQTEGGEKVRMMMDWYMGEMVLFNYTFTDRFEYELKDAELELKTPSTGSAETHPARRHRVHQPLSRHFQISGVQPAESLLPRTEVLEDADLPL